MTSSDFIDNNQKAYALDQLKLLFRRQQGVEIFLIDYTEAFGTTSTTTEKWNVTIDGWNCDSEFNSLEEAIIAAKLRSDRMQSE